MKKEDIKLCSTCITLLWHSLNKPPTQQPTWPLSFPHIKN